MVCDDIFRRTGLRFQSVASIARNDRDVIERILPIAREWVLSSSGGLRRALLFHAFLTPHALPYLDDVLEWSTTPASKFERELFTQILRVLVTSKTARRIWTTFQKLEPTDSDPLLLTRLARVASISDEVVEPILKFLGSTAERIAQGELVRTFATGPLSEYVKVRHPRVKEWFAQYLKSSDPELRALARRSNGIKPVLHEGCRIARGMPDHSRLILSTEINSHRLGDFLRELERDMGAEFVPVLQPDQIVENLTERKWLVADAWRSTRGPLELWLRLEDTTTVEAWVIGARASRPN